MEEIKPTYEELKAKLLKAEKTIYELTIAAKDNTSPGENAAFPNEQEFIEAYIESEENFRNSMDSCPLGIRVITNEGDLFYANQAILDMFGYQTVEELKAVPKNRLYTLQSYTEYLERKKKRINNEFTPSEYQISIKHPDGEIKTLQVLRKEIIWGGERQFMAMYEDITERLKMEAGLRYHASLVESVCDAIVSSDAEFKILSWNKAAEAMYGWSEPEVIGKSVMEVTNLDLIDVTPEQIKEEIHKNNHWRGEAIHSRKNGEKMNVFFSVSLMKNEHGEEIGAITIFRDITESKKIEQALKNREEFLNTVIESTPSPLWVSDANGTIIRINQALRNLLKVRDEEIIGKYNVLKDTQVAEQGFLPLVKSVYEEGKTASFILNYRTSKEKQVQIASDTSLVLEVTVSAVKDGQGRVTHVICQERDITDRINAEKALEENQQRFYGAFHHSPSMNLIANHTNGRIVELNKAFCEVTGYTKEEALGKTGTELNLWYDEAQKNSIFAELNEKGIISNRDAQFRVKAGEVRLFNMNMTVITQNNEPYIFASMIDITKRKQAEMALQASEKRYRDSLENMMEGCQIIDHNWRYIYFNDASARLGHFNKNELLGRIITDVYPDIEKTKIFAAYKKCMEQRTPVRMEQEAFTKNGVQIWLDISIQPIPEGIFVLSLDITERKQAEERINHLNLALRALRNINQLITREKNPEHLIKDICDNLVTGRSFHSAWIILLDENRQPVNWAGTNVSRGLDGMVEAFRRGDLPHCVQKAINQKKVVVTKKLKEQCAGCPVLSGTEGIGSMTARLEFDGTLYGVLCGSMWDSLLIDEEEISLFSEVAADITFALRDIELSSAHALLQQEQTRAAKLESIGTLAGGIAHDFNNLLTGIMGNIGLAKTMLPPDSSGFEMLDEAEKAAVRSRDLTQQLLTFARGGKPIKKIVNVTALIRDAAIFALRGSKIKLEMALPENLWLVEADEGQLVQVIHNLVLNADEAMPEGGTITITASNLIVKRGTALPLSRGNYIQINIRDTGTGISPENLQKICEPYFTTKREGSGLGLTSAYSIIKNHGGALLAESSLNQGSVFHVYLPASRKTAKGEKKLAEKKAAQAGGNVLIMDDDEIIRKMLKNMLNLAGYEVTATADGAEALEKYKQAMELRNPYNAVIMDLTVPGGMGGKEATAKLLEIDPAACVIVSSGYATDPIMSEYKKYGFSAVIAKPYSIGQLQETISSVTARRKK